MTSHDHLTKLVRQRGEQLAAVTLDQTARNLFNKLYGLTSIRWAELGEHVGRAPGETALVRAVARLCAAGLAIADDVRLRISEDGITMGERDDPTQH